jgi:hypothetical protein
VLAKVISQPLDLFTAYAYSNVLADYKLTDSDWRELRDLEVVLQVGFKIFMLSIHYINSSKAAHLCQRLMSSSRTPLLAAVIPSFELLMTKWETLGEKHPRLRRFTDEGLRWATKYYTRMDDTDLYVIAMCKQ